MERGEPTEVFFLETGHRVAVYERGELGGAEYADHEVVLIEDAGSLASNLEAATAAVARRIR